MNKTLIIITAYIIVVAVLIVIFIAKTSKQNKKIRNSIEELEKEKNLIINAPILNELSNFRNTLRQNENLLIKSLLIEKE